MSNVKKIMTFAVFVTSFMMLTSCSTIKGFGKDVTRTGHDIQRAAN